ncbi:MAG: stage V sporulation protein AD [Lachnospiraceae bacterium]|nr:stage V sporulation protein AD [Lachnospiraceae bacterium]
MKTGKASIKFEKPPCIIGAASVVGKKEGDGPLGACFDQVEEDDKFGMDSWEMAESECQKRTFLAAVQDAQLADGRKPDFLFAGDLLNQLSASSFGLLDFQIPLLGLYGACSTMGEAMGMAAAFVAGGMADTAAAIASSHFAGAQKQFRFPLEYGNQRPYAATWTVTGSGSVIIASHPSVARCSEKLRPYAYITGVTIGKIVDYGVKDSTNMGAVMAPAAADTILQHLQDMGRRAQDYDKIITGDLGTVGQTILIDLLSKNGVDISGNHMDCGIEIYDAQSQDTHAGGSGCGCSAAVLCGHVLKKLLVGQWEKVLFVPTGALFSPVSFNEGQNIPGIAHAVVLEAAQ